ncbi:MAG: DNA modification methylase [Chlorobium sp.]|jgi:site-specific DNA-methyltransferase (adenine-specific)|nr:DNA modification methylase [Chlorobium sp.]
MKLAEIRPNPANPRLIKDDKFKKLVQSLRDFPQMMELRPIIIDENNIIQGGNMRYKALLEIGFTEIPDTWVKQGKDLTQEQWREFVIKDNLGFGEWDWDVISNEWDSQQLTDWGLDLPEFETPIEVKDDDYDIPDEIETDIIAGDLFEIGPHRLICGDSTKAETFERLFEGEKADLVITDPPYNVDYEGGTKEKLTIQNDNMSDSDFYQFLFDFYSALALFTKPGGAWYVWHSDSEGANFRSAMKNAGIMVKQCLIWVKNSMVMGRQDYQWRHEPCLYGWKEGAAHEWFSDRKQTTILEFDRPQRNSEHPTMKPVPLIAYQVQNSSRKGAIVADGFGGSGTTMVASHQLDRRCYMAEFDPKYCQVIIDRMTKLDPDIEVKKNGEIYQALMAV